MQLHQLPRGRQVSIHGNIVNVPTDVNTVIPLLPRRQNEAACIPVKLKRKLSYQHQYMYENIQPQKVLDALKWLIDNSELYKQEGITMNQKWSYGSEDAAESEEMDSVDKSDSQPDEDGDEDDQNDLPAGPFDTMLQCQDVMQESRHVLTLAPGEAYSWIKMLNHCLSLLFTVAKNNQKKQRKEYSTVNFADQN